MQETELKFQIPAASEAAVARAVATASAVTTRLQAIYYDTPDRRLAKAGAALRLRKEGRHWVQTVKAAGASSMQRLEHEVRLPAGVPAALDTARHDGTPAGDLLLRLVPVPSGVAGDAAPALQECYRTDIRRIHRALRVPGGAVELALDRGNLIAGKRRLPVAELELELLRGTPAMLIEVARRWVARHGLWLDVRSKAERGDRLARGLQIGEPARGGDSPLHRDMTVNDARGAALLACLAHILPNASEIAGGRFADEHVHQLRVGLRRLRSLLRFLRGWVPEFDAGVGPATAELFRALGGTRDRDALAASLLPALQAAGAPTVDLPHDDAVQDVAALLRGTGVNQLWLDLLGAAHPQAAPQSPAYEPPPLERRMSRRLQRWHGQIAADPQGFLALDDTARHEMRKRIKRLRYAAEFAAPLYRPKAVRRYLKQLRPLQEQLGLFNDLAVAAAAYQSRVEADPRAWFALGWIASRREEVLARCAEALTAFAKAKPFWRKR